jgi:hypothetical protein
MTKIEYMGTTITNQNFTHEKIKMRLNFANAYYAAIQSLLFLWVLS